MDYVKVGSPEHVELWDAINAFSVASGARPSTTSIARQHAVVQVEASLVAIACKCHDAGYAEAIAAERERVREVAMAVRRQAMVDMTSPGWAAKEILRRLGIAMEVPDGK